jgi:TolA-binding protein
MKLLLPWLCVLGLLIGLGWLYSAGQKKEAEIVVLREDSKQLQQLRAEQEEAKSARTQAETDELARLRKDSEELRRLRNEVQQLRGDKQQLATQVQTAQTQAQRAQEQIQAQAAAAAQPAPGTPADAAAQAALKARLGQNAPTPEQVQTLACVNNLRMIDGAKQQWALEKQKSGGSLLTAADLAPYLKGNALPTCPAGGIYTLNPVSVAPICSIPGHTIAK